MNESHDKTTNHTKKIWHQDLKTQMFWLEVSLFKILGHFMITKKRCDVSPLHAINHL